MPRVSLRRVGEASGCIAKLPESFGELLATADTKLLKQQSMRSKTGASPYSRLHKMRLDHRHFNDDTLVLYK